MTDNQDPATLEEAIEFIYPLFDNRDGLFHTYDYPERFTAICLSGVTGIGQQIIDILDLDNSDTILYQHFRQCHHLTHRAEMAGAILRGIFQKYADTHPQFKPNTEHEREKRETKGKPFKEIVYGTLHSK